MDTIVKEIGFLRTFKSMTPRKITFKIPNKPWSESHGVYGENIGGVGLYF